VSVYRTVVIVVTGNRYIWWLIGEIIASKHHSGGASLYHYVMTKQTPATDVTLNPSLAEILLELVESSIMLLLQAKNREILSPPCLIS
jgi:hypothetical protein